METVCKYVKLNKDNSYLKSNLGCSIGMEYRHFNIILLAHGCLFYSFIHLVFSNGSLIIHFFFVYWYDIKSFENLSIFLTYLILTYIKLMFICFDFNDINSMLYYNSLPCHREKLNN